LVEKTVDDLGLKLHLHRQKLVNDFGLFQVDMIHLTNAIQIIITTKLSICLCPELFDCNVHTLKKTGYTSGAPCTFASSIQIYTVLNS
jgi:hypothetical protein